MRRTAQTLVLLTLTTLCAYAHAQDAAPTTQGVAHFPNVSVDVKKKQVRVDCQALNVDIRLEFFCVLTGTNEHESVLRSDAKPSDIHTALLMCGLTPGEPVKYSESTQKWLPPHGPPLHISCEYVKDGKTVNVPAYRMLRNADTKKTPAAFTWIFAGSRVMDDGKYAADVTGYTVSVVNFDLTLIDVPELASNANETLEWEYNPDTVPKTGTPITMIIEPAGGAIVGDAGNGVSNGGGKMIEPLVLKLHTDGTMDLNGEPVAADGLPAAIKKLPADPAAIRIAAAKDADPAAVTAAEKSIEAAGRTWQTVDASSPTTNPTTNPAGDANAPISDVHLDEQKMADLKARWEKIVRPNADALRTAAQAHYDVISSMRKEQQRLINEADRIQRAMDELEKEYQDMTTPHPPADQ